MFLQVSNAVLSAGSEGGGGMLGMVLPFVVLIAVFYFLLIRPENKKKKAAAKMRSELTIGDQITTIGGIMGKVISIKEETDSLVIETGVDRSKVRVKRWAVASCDTIHDDVE